MKRLLLLLCMAVTAPALCSEVDIRNACQLEGGSDEIFVVKVSSGLDACKNKRCFAGIYRGTVVGEPSKGRSSASGHEVEFTTSAGIQIGESYLIFANIIRPNERSITFLGSGEETSYVVPENVGYYVPIEGAFLSANRGYYRTVADGCIGDGPECKVVSAIRNNGVLKADVLYPGLLDELRTCKPKKTRRTRRE